jgi:hypothetical protein
LDKQVNKKYWAQEFSELNNLYDFSILVNSVLLQKSNAFQRVYGEYIRTKNLYILYEFLTEVNKRTERITFEEFRCFIRPDCQKKFYKEFKIKKRNGKERVIHAPQEKLLLTLKAFSKILYDLHNSHENSNGFEKQKSVILNASHHIKSNYVFNIDLKDFFWSIDRQRIKRMFLFDKQINFKENISKRSNLLSEKKYEREPLAFYLASLVTIPILIDNEIRYVLPQGSPTSPIISNIICKILDRRLTGLAKRFGVVYTRYADDITFSAQKNVFILDDFRNELERIIESQGFKINSEKVKVINKGYRQTVTGIVVNEKLNVHRKYIKELRRWLYLWERYGYIKANGIFKTEYKKINKLRSYPNLIKTLKGKLEFLKNVKGCTDSIYKKLFSRFEELMKKRTFDYLINYWDKQGFYNLSKFVFKNLTIIEFLTLIYNNQDELDLKKIQEFIRFFEKIPNRIKGFINFEFNFFVHNPLNTSNFLREFSSNIKLKFFTHYPTKKIDYQEYIKQAEQELQNISKKPISQKVYANVKNFLVGEKWENYFGDEMQYTWKRILQENPDEEDIHEVILDNKGTSWESIINKFKTTIECRKEDWNISFEKIIKKITKEHSKELYFSLHIDDFEKELYVDKRLIYRSVEKIIYMIKHYNEDNKNVEIFFKKDDAEKIIIKIIHKNNIIKTSPQTLQNKSNKGDFVDIRELLFGVADFYIISKFLDGKIYKVTYLEKDKFFKFQTKENSNFRPAAIEEKQVNVEGVEYYIVLYNS